MNEYQVTTEQITVTKRIYKVKAESMKKVMELFENATADTDPIEHLIETEINIGSEKWDGIKPL